MKIEAFTFTKHGNKNPWLVATDKRGEGHIIATLKVPPEEFWQRLGDALGITFIDHTGKHIEAHPDKDIKEG